MSLAIQHNIGAFIKVLTAYIHSLTAGAATDNVEKTGVTIDRLANGSALSAVLSLAYTATLAEGKKLGIGYTVEHGDAADMSDASDFLDVAAATVATGGAGGSTETGVLSSDVDLAGAKRYIRLLFKADLDAANTDTATVAATVILGGADTLPL